MPDLSSVSTAQPHTACSISCMSLTVFSRFMPHAIVDLDVPDGVVVYF